jgi:lipoprotein-anchoring transpeptidase ErfK/SrfK
MASAAPEASASPALTGTTPAMTGSAATVSGTTPAVTGTETAAVPSPTPPSPYSIELDLGRQRAFLLKDGKQIAESPVSSGREGHLTPTGNFSVIQKDLNHFSNLYGKIVEKGSGRVVKSGADVATPIPKGCKFVPAPMKWFMRFEGAAGMHAGILPGYPASHGCVRMPVSKAELFYKTVKIGTPVHVFGTPPFRSAREEAAAAPHHHAVTSAAATKAAPTPAPTPKAKHGWWIF